MKKFFGAIFHPVVLAILGLLALAAVIWWVGPLIAIADFYPFEPTWVRLGLILLVLLVVTGRLAWRAWRKRKAESALAEGMAAAPPPSAGEQEVNTLNDRFTQALTVLRDSQHRSFWQRGQALYDLPWYIFIGAPGSGKTTALLNAGLTFPLAAKLGQAPIQGVGGTRNCDWWFTDEAVLIDTAGRYTTQQSDAAADATAWDGFLGLLKKNRPRRPINGVLLTVNVQDLLQQSPAERQLHASQLRARLQELNEKLGIRAPVYVLVTKADLVAGFNETFQNLGKEERDQVFGFSLPLAVKGDAKAMAAAKADVLAPFSPEVDALTTRLRAQLVDRMQAEREVLVRASIFAFPQQFEALKPVLGEFLGQVFGGAGALDEPAFVRGVYFTSGTQEGTPIDRVLGTLARTFGVERKLSGLAAGSGKSFFLNRLLREVVFAEQGLVGVNRRAEKTRAVVRAAAFAVIGVVSLIMLIGWGISGMRNKAYVEDVAGRLPALKQAVDAVPEATTGEVAAIAGAMTAVRAAPQPGGFPLADPPLLNSLGLYQGDKLDAGAQIAYRHLLEHGLLPRVARRSEELLRTANRNNIEFAYEALKAYLMLHTPERFDAEALKGWIALDWDSSQRNLSAEQRAQLDGHLDALLALGAPQRLPAMDMTLVGGVRDMLASFPTQARVYSRLKRLRLGQEFPEFTVANAAGPQASVVFERISGQPLTKGVPGLFTRDGYHKAFQGAVEKAAAQTAAEEGWVLGVQSDRTAVKEALTGNAALTDAVRSLYFDEYIRVWDQYIADVRMVKLTNDINRSAAIAALLAGPDSPLKRYITAVVKQTTLVLPDGPASLTKKIDEKAESVKKGLKDLLGTVAGPVPNAQVRPEQRVDDHFAALRRMTEGTPPPLDNVQKAFNDVYVQLSAVAAAAGSKSPPPPPAGAERAKADAKLQPEPIASMLASLADASISKSSQAETANLTGDLRPIAEFCQKSIAGRYPFASGSASDALPDDFGQLFGVGGMLDDFFRTRLAPLVDMGTNPWSYRPNADGTRRPTPAALVDFQRASKIREAFFRSGGKSAGFKLDVRALSIAEGLKEVTIDIDGQAFKFTPGNTAPVTISWPSARVASQIKLSATPAGVTQTFDGPWALFRMFDRFDVQPTAQPEKFNVTMTVDGKPVRLEVTANSVFNPFRLREMQQFRCPGAL
ncbi:type VI secretion system membrane subunit TssM [soil metagenome]